MFSLCNDQIDISVQIDGLKPPLEDVTRPFQFTLQVEENQHWIPDEFIFHLNDLNGSGLGF